MAGPEPLILCMENISGEEVALNIEPEDTFHVFLEKAKILLGYDVDISSITGNQPVSLDSNIYTFLLKAEQHFESSTLNPQNFDEIIDQNETDDLVYILNDGTQIRASQIQFDNDDPIMDLTAEELPFVKYKDDSTGENEIDNMDTDVTIRNVNIIGSPIARWSNKENPKRSFANSLPFNLVCNNSLNFEAQFDEYLESNSKTNTNLSNVSESESPKSLIKDKSYDDSLFTREDVLNMFKDTPVTTLPINKNQTEKLRNVRKTHLSRKVHNNWNAKPTNIIDVETGLEKQKCFICCNTVNNHDKLYLFDKEDQMLHKCERKYNTQLKIICNRCLTENFKPSSIKSPNQSLENNEYLVIKNNQQFIFQKTTSIDLKSSYYLDNINMNNSNNVNKINKLARNKENAEFVKVEIGPDGEIVTKPVDNDVKFDDVMIVKEKKESSSDVEIVETDVMEPEPEIDVDDLENVDEEVKEFLGKYQCNIHNMEFKCRFCQKEFKDFLEVIDHAEEHKHDLDEGTVFPCPFCDYGYSNSKWLKGHLKAAHDVKKHDESIKRKKDDDKHKKDDDKHKKDDDKHKKDDFEQEKDDNKQQKDDVEQQKGNIKEKYDVKQGKDDDKHEKNDEQVKADDKQQKDDVKQQRSDKKEQSDVKQEKDNGKQEKDAVEHEKYEFNQQKDDMKEDDMLENENETVIQENDDTEKTNSPECSPVAKRTRSAIKRKDIENTDNGKHENEDTKETNLQEQEKVKSEVKQESQDSSDCESIWIVQTGDDDEELKNLLQVSFVYTGNFTESQDSSDGESIWIVQTGDDDEELKYLLQISAGKQDGHRNLKRHKCFACSQIFPTAVSLSTHKCRKRGKKRQFNLTQDESAVVSKKEDVVKRPCKRKNRKLDDPPIVTCHNCNESFTSKVRLKFHMQFHEPTKLLRDGQYACAVCENARFPTETELFDHVHFQHTKQKRWQCPVKDCGKKFLLRATLTKHSRTHTDTRRYVCVTCGKRFLDKQTLDEHGVTHLLIKPFQCHICLKQLTRRSRLRMHLRAHEEELSPALVLVCAICSRAFRGHGDAQEHATKSTECIEAFTSDIKQEDESTEQLSPTSGIVRHSVRVVELSRVKTPIPKEMNNEDSEKLLSPLDDGAKNIIRVVLIEKAFRCEYCEDVFYLEGPLNNHRISHKDIKNPFTCHICKVRFATYSRCTTHKTTHGFYKRNATEGRLEERTGPANAGILGYGGFPVAKHFLCEDCGRSYLHWTYFQVHRRMKHANEKFMFKCNQCELIFPNSWSATYHRKKVHNKNGQDENGGFTKIVQDNYRIPCRDCEEVLPNKIALYKHRQKEHCDASLIYKEDDCSDQEEPETTICNKCGHNLHSVVALQKHVKDVHGCSSGGLCARAHTCPVCARVFRSASVRNEHVRAHTDDQPISCDVCGVTFTRAIEMRNHRLIHSGTRPWGCTRCPKRFRVKSDLKTHMKVKHPTHLAVIEIEATSCTPEEILQQLKNNNISQDRVIEITMISFPKDSTNIVPNSMRALSMLSDVPRTKIDCNWDRNMASHAQSNTFQPIILPDRGIEKTPRKPLILQRSSETSQYSQDTWNIPVQNVVEEAPQRPTILQENNDSSQKPQDTYNITPLQNIHGEAPWRPAILQRTDEASQNLPDTYNITPLQNVEGEVRTILQRSNEVSHKLQDIYSITPLRNVDVESLSTLNVQLLLEDGSAGNGNQMDLQLDDGLLN